MSHLLRCSLAVLILCLLGCDKSPSGSGNSSQKTTTAEKMQVDYSSFKNKAPGMTKEQLKANFGQPSKVSEFNLGIKWDYELVNHPDTGGRAQCAAYFDNRVDINRVSEVVNCFTIKY